MMNHRKETIQYYFLCVLHTHWLYTCIDLVVALLRPLVER